MSNPHAPDHWISVDPGTLLTGVTLWEGEQPVNTWLLKNSAKDGVGQRIVNILADLEAIITAHKATLVVVERPFARGRSNDAMNTLFRDINAWAKQRKLKFAPYWHTSVKAALRRLYPKLRGLDGKLLLTAAVCAFYPGFPALSQDEIDSVAIGLAHLHPLPPKAAKKPKRKAA